MSGNQDEAPDRWWHVRRWEDRVIIRFRGAGEFSLSPDEARDMSNKLFEGQLDARRKDGHISAADAIGALGEHARRRRMEQEKGGASHETPEKTPAGEWDQIQRRTLGDGAGNTYADSTSRLAVAGGWLYRVQVGVNTHHAALALAYVPDPYAPHVLAVLWENQQKAAEAYVPPTARPTAKPPEDEP
jgi:hypothetical protein